MDQNPNNEYFITYSNSFYFEGELLAFRKKQLFNISNTPKLIPYNEKCSCWIVNRKQLTILKAKELVNNVKTVVDVSNLQWFNQINLDHVFNL
jgi:hypothetical protein